MRHCAASRKPVRLPYVPAGHGSESHLPREREREDLPLFSRERLLYSTQKKAPSLRKAPYVGKGRGAFSRGAAHGAEVALWAEVVGVVRGVGGAEVALGAERAVRDGARPRLVVVGPRRTGLGTKARERARVVKETFFQTWIHTV